MTIMPQKFDKDLYHVFWVKGKDGRCMHSDWYNSFEQAMAGFLSVHNDSTYDPYWFEEVDFDKSEYIVLNAETEKMKFFNEPNFE